MIFSRKKKFIFAHNPKTAGTSIRKALLKEVRPFEQSIIFKVIRRFGNFAYQYPFYDFLNRPHTTLYQASLLIPPNIFSECFKFGIVRDPYDWAFSVYRHYLRYCYDYPDRELKISKNISDFSDFMTALKKTTVPHQSFAFIDLNGKFIGNSLGSFSHLDRYISYIEPLINTTIETYYLNRNPVKIDYNFSAKQKSMIEDIWSYDFAFFRDFQTDNSGQIILPEICNSVPYENFKNYDCWNFLGRN